VLVTHDRHLIRSVADRIVEVRDGRVTAYEGDYDFYLAMRRCPGAPAPRRPAAATGSAADRRRASAQARAAVRDLRSSLGRIEKELEALASEIKDISERLGDPAVYASGADVAGLVDDYETKTGRVKELEAAWEEAAGLLESQGASV